MAGRKMWKAVPMLGTDWTKISPPWSRMIWWQMGRPQPLPSGLVVKRLWKR